MNDKLNTMFDLAAKEKTITPMQIAEEIQPLLKEYFIGNFELGNNVLNMRFKNGQSFKLYICEVI